MIIKGIVSFYQFFKKKRSIKNGEKNSHKGWYVLSPFYESVGNKSANSSRIYSRQAIKTTGVCIRFRQNSITHDFGALVKCSIPCYTLS
jgi:hypothetical protein